MRNEQSIGLAAMIQALACTCFTLLPAESATLSGMLSIHLPDSPDQPLSSAMRPKIPIP